MQKNVKISVIIGVYNCADTLSEAMNSLLAQTYQDFEVIICDDGSKDGTRDIAQRYCDQYPGRFTLLINERNLGLNKTLNKCLHAAKGEYIARMDGDDISLPTRFEKEVAFLDANPEFAIVSTPMIFFDENGDWGKGTAIEYPQKSDFNLHSPFFCHAPCMVRKEAYLTVGGYSEDPRTLRFEDCHLWYKMYAHGYVGYNIQEPLYKMRDDRNAFNRRTLKSRMNAVYVKYVGFKMLNMPWYMYIYIVRTFVMSLILGLMPEDLYHRLHRSRMKGN